MVSAVGAAGRGGGMSSAIAAPDLTRWLGSRIVAPSTVTAPALINALSRLRDSSATCAASTRSSRCPVWSSGAWINLRSEVIGNEYGDGNEQAFRGHH